MHRLLTRLLLRLAVLALPLQEFAATIIVARGDTVDDARIALTTPDDGTVMSDGYHEHGGVVATGTEPKTPVQSHCKTCPICVACSLGSIVPLTANLGMPLVKLSGAVPRGLAVSFRSFIPEALQRPSSIRV